MKTFWAAVLKYATKLAVYAAVHPDQVIALVNDIAAAQGRGPQK
jgi:hypothetical protein